MAAPKTTIWELEPHTRAKHEILKRYLQAWIPILSQRGFPQVLYIDGFAGPGIYSNGEEGSPIIAINAALAQRVPIRATVLFLFVEKNPDRASTLREIVNEIKLPDNFRTKISGGETFEDAYNDLVNFYNVDNRSWPPTFAFIDPFGWIVPFAIVKEILGRRSCEVLVTFMYEEINRFIGLPDQVENFDRFFGTPDWRDGINLKNPSERNRFLHDLYNRQLKEDANAKYVRSFQMRNDRDVTDYYLFYATNNIRGIAKMKEAMWKVDQSGEFTFSDATDPNQSILFGNEPDFRILHKEISDHFSGQIVTVGEIEEFVLAETAFRETHYKRQVLRVMENSNPPQLSAVDPPKDRRRGSFSPNSLKIKFSNNPT